MSISISTSTSIYTIIYIYIYVYIYIHMYIYIYIYIDLECEMCMCFFHLHGCREQIVSISEERSLKVRWAPRGWCRPRTMALCGTSTPARCPSTAAIASSCSRKRKLKATPEAQITGGTPPSVAHCNDSVPGDLFGIWFE